MKYFVREKNTDRYAFHTAGVKARVDADAILQKNGYIPIDINFVGRRSGNVRSIFQHAEIASLFKEKLRFLRPDDTLVIQFPPINHSIFFKGVVRALVMRGVTVTALIHDLETIRLSNSDDLPVATRFRLKREEVSVLALFSRLIVHNDSMRRYLSKTLGIPSVRMRVLGIFDYLTDAPLCKPSDSVTVAGNLSMQKAGYVYYLPDGVDFLLYGPSYEGIPLKNVTYRGSFAPNKLPYVLEGGFGLVWDGDSPDTCTGVFGNYLRYNAPHKTSLYLALGIPVIIWDKAALADFVIKNNCGIAVSSLDLIPSAIKTADVPQLRAGAVEISKKLRSGYFLSSAL